VEFAPYQKVPPEKKKPDNKNATIEKGTETGRNAALGTDPTLDEDYISFIQSLNAPANAEPVTIDSLRMSIVPLHAAQIDRTPDKSLLPVRLLLPRQHPSSKPSRLRNRLRRTRRLFYVTMPTTRIRQA
jgi:Smg-4/UPF3 family